MSNDFYNASGTPSTRASGKSSDMRSEFAAIQAAFDKMPTLASNAGKLLQVNASGNALSTASTISIDASGNVSFSANVTIGDAAGDALTVNPSAVSWPGNPTHSGNHTFSGNVAINGNTTIGDAAADTLAINPNTITIPNGINLTGGNVGVGRTPAALVDVQGSGQAQVRVRGGAGSGQGGIFTATAGSDTTIAGFGEFAALYGGSVQNAAAIYSVGYLDFGSNGSSSRMRLDTSGNLGIGTTNTGGFRFVVASPNGTAADMTVTQSGIGTWSWQIPASTNALRLWNGSSELARFNSNGTLTIAAGSGVPMIENTVGTGAGRVFHVGQTGGDGYLGMSPSTGGGLVFGSAAYSMELRSDAGFYWGIGSTLKMVLDNAGKFGVGGAPSAPIDFQMGYMALRNGSYTGYLGNANSLVTSGLATDFALRSDSNLLFTSGGAAERMRLDTSGNLLVGTPSASAWATANRALVELNGGASGAIFGMKISGSQAGYLYHTGTDFQVVNVLGGALQLATNNTVRMTITSGGVIQDAAGIELGWKGMPLSTTTSGSIPVTEKGKIIPATAGVTVPNATFAAGDSFGIYNDSASAITITAGITTLRQGGTANTGNRTLAARGMATVWFKSGTEAIISGSGLT